MDGKSPDHSGSGKNFEIDGKTDGQRATGDERRVAECIRYFRQTPGFHRLLVGLKEKYRSLGTVGGKIYLPNLNPLERSALTGLLRRDFHRQKDAVVKVSEIAAALDRTRFFEVNLEEVVRGYWGDEILPKKEERRLYDEQRRGFFTSVMEGFSSPAAVKWLTETLEKKENAYKALVTRFSQDPEGLRRDLAAVGRALAELPYLTGKKIQLALFASKITADPHFFDREKPAGQLLLYALMYIFNERKPETVFAEAELLYKAGLYNTEITNYTVCRGLLGYLPGGQAHPGWLGFYRNGETLQVSLENLSRLEEVKSPGGKVFVMENPTIFSALADRWEEIRSRIGRRQVKEILEQRSVDKSQENDFPPTLPMVCTNGQVNLATLVLLDLLVKSGSTLYYSGDFDPEGLLIADKLKAKYGEGLILWHYTKEDYRRTVSGQRLSAGRIKKLSGLKNEDLIGVGKVVTETGFAGYQELLLEDLWADVMLNFNLVYRLHKPRGFSC